MSFGHLFTQQAKQYALARPTYPPSLFAAIQAFAAKVASASPASSAPSIAVDLACGNGQATLALAQGQDYDQVIGIDIAKEQIAEAPTHDKIRYLVGSFDSLASQVEPGSAKLVAVAQAFHWFEFGTAFEQINQVLRKPDGICAVWGYANPVLPNPAAEHRVNVEFYLNQVGPYWSDRRLHVDNRYTEIEAAMRKAFSLVEVSRGSLTIQREVSVADFVTYLSSWSAYQTWKKQHPQAEDLLTAVKADLLAAFGFDSDQRTFTCDYPIFLLLGANPKSA